MPLETDDAAQEAESGSSSNPMPVLAESPNPAEVQNKKRKRSTKPNQAPWPPIPPGPMTCKPLTLTVPPKRPKLSKAPSPAPPQVRVAHKPLKPWEMLADISKNANNLATSMQRWSQDIGGVVLDLTSELTPTSVPTGTPRAQAQKPARVKHKSSGAPSTFVFSVAPHPPQSAQGHAGGIHIFSVDGAEAKRREDKMAEAGTRLRIMAGMMQHAAAVAEGWAEELRSLSVEEHVATETATQAREETECLVREKDGKIADLQVRLVSAMEECVRVKEQLARRVEDGEKAREENAGLTTRVAELEASLDAARKENVALKARDDELERSSADVQKENAALTATITELRERVAEKEGQVHAELRQLTTGDIPTLKTDLLVARSDTSRLQKMHTTFSSNVTGRLSVMEKAFAEICNLKTSLLDQIKKSDKEIVDLKRRLSESESRLIVRENEPVGWSPEVLKWANDLKNWTEERVNTISSESVMRYRELNEGIHALNTTVGGLFHTQDVLLARAGIPTIPSIGPPPVEMTMLPIEAGRPPPPIIAIQDTSDPPQ